ncbi:MAG TPA: ATP-binding cassette domain-containing protein [Vicinamibacterales bacterium]|nr:ATP-binding cassette domain-containing protein [Vicinamibacterales bacterium]
MPFAAGRAPAGTRQRVRNPDDANAIVFDRVSLAFDDHVVLRDLSFTVPKGSMRIVFGVSGAGKSLMLKLALGLLRPDAGTITVNGYRVDEMPEQELLRMRADIGMVFQENALFDSLTVAENVGFRLYEEHEVADAEIERRIQEVLGFVGLREFADRMPSALSGGQRRRVGIARAMASKPSLLLFDDPITGLDPIIATSIDDEIVKLRDLEDVTTVVVTHQIRDAFYIAEHQAVRNGDTVSVSKGDAPDVEFMVLLDGSIKFQGTAAELLASKDPYLTEYLYKTLPPW